jgi:hypothetical protein
LGVHAGAGYLRPGVLGDLFKRLVNGVVLLLGALAFFLVPVGGKTAAQHLVAIFSTKPAQEAAVAFADAARQLAQEVAREVEHARKAASAPTSSPPSRPSAQR